MTVVDAIRLLENVDKFGGGYLEVMFNKTEPQITLFSS